MLEVWVNNPPSDVDDVATVFMPSTKGINSGDWVTCKTPNGYKRGQVTTTGTHEIAIKMFSEIDPPSATTRLCSKAKNKYLSLIDSNIVWIAMLSRFLTVWIGVGLLFCVVMLTVTFPILFFLLPLSIFGFGFYLSFIAEHNIEN